MRTLTDAPLDRLGGGLAAVLDNHESAAFERNTGSHEAFPRGAAHEKAGATCAPSALLAGLFAAAANEEVQARSLALAAGADEEVDADARTAGATVTAATFLVHCTRATCGSDGNGAFQQLNGAWGCSFYFCIRCTYVYCWSPCLRGHCTLYMHACVRGYTGNL